MQGHTIWEFKKYVYIHKHGSNGLQNTVDMCCTGLYCISFDHMNKESHDGTGQERCISPDI